VLDSDPVTLAAWVEHAECKAAHQRPLLLAPFAGGNRLDERADLRGDAL
jgi:hypothetical protein